MGNNETRHRTGLLTRRGAILAAAGTAGTLLLSGCSQGPGDDTGADDAGEGAWTPTSGAYLPLGSVVRIGRSSNPDTKLMITARRPLSDLEGSEAIHDYAGVLWPFGRLSNVDEAPWEGDITKFENEDIVEVLFTGYVDGDEERAALELAGAGDGVSSYILGDMLKESASGN